MNNQKNPIKKDIFYSNLKEDDALSQQARDVQNVMKQINDREQKKYNEQKSANKNNKQGSPSDKIQNIQKIKDEDNDSQLLLGWSDKPLGVDQLSLSKDIIRFNGPLIEMSEKQDEDIKQATLKIQKLWKSKYRTIIKVNKEQKQQNDESQDSKLENEQIPKKQSSDIDKEFTFMPDKSPFKKIKNGSPPSNIIPQIKIIEDQGYLNKHKQKKTHEQGKQEEQDVLNKNFQCHQDQQSDQNHKAEKIEKNQKLEKASKPLEKGQKIIMNKDENKNQQLIQKDLQIQKEQQIQKDEKNQKEQQMQKDQMKKLISQKSNKPSQRPQSEIEQRKNNAQIIKIDSPNLQPNVAVNKINFQLEKRYMDKDKMSPKNQENQMTQINKKEQVNIQKLNSKEPNQLQDKQNECIVESKKAMISQIISKQIQQKNNEKKQGENPQRQQQVQQQIQYQKPQKEQKVISNHSSKWELKDKEVLIKLVEVYGQNKWSEIASHLPNKTSDECQSMFQKLQSL